MKPGESFVRQPVRSLQTMLRVLSKNDPSLPAVVPDGVYGPTTMQAISAFQRKYGLAVTGVTNQETWEQIFDAYEIALIDVGKAESIEILLDPGQILRKGDSNPYIYLAQAMLIQLSNSTPLIDPPSTSGILDNTTESAIAAFQKLSAIESTGELNRLTWKHLAKQFTLSANHESNNNYKMKNF